MPLLPYVCFLTLTLVNLPPSVQDAFLLTMMHRHGYGAARRIQLEIRRAWQFRFDWFFKSRSPQEIQKRCDVLIKIVERELEELHEKEDKETVAKAELASLEKPVEETANPFINKLTDRVCSVAGTKPSGGEAAVAEKDDGAKTEGVQPPAAESMEVEKPTEAGPTN